jgi:hypothetical protein
VTKKPFKERSPREQAQIVGYLVLSLVVVSLAQNDLRRRPASQIRGSKTIWRIVSLNALGALIYLVWGRSSKQ